MQRPRNALTPQRDQGTTSRAASQLAGHRAVRSCHLATRMAHGVGVGIALPRRACARATALLTPARAVLRTRPACAHLLSTCSSPSSSSLARLGARSPGPSPVPRMGAASPWPLRRPSNHCPLPSCRRTFLRSMVPTSFRSFSCTGLRHEHDSGYGLAFPALPISRPRLPPVRLMALLSGGPKRCSG